MFQFCEISSYFLFVLGFFPMLSMLKKLKGDKRLSENQLIPKLKIISKLNSNQRKIFFSYAKLSKDFKIQKFDNKRIFSSKFKRKLLIILKTLVDGNLKLEKPFIPKI